MDAKGLQQLVTKYEENKDFITNEETAKMALIVPFLRLLGYDPNMPREVRAEYAADFTQGDGKRLPDRMDYAIFDKAGAKPLFVVEAKPLGTDLRSRTQQLARYISQLPGLHFGIITDGCHYLFFGDLDRENVMDAEPFFSFALDDEQADWSKTAKFLNKFSRDTFNAETLLTDAENSRYRQAMVEKLAAALRDPAGDEAFLKWLTGDVYKGKRTTSVMSRLGRVAKDAIEPALLSVMGDSFLDNLKSRIAAAHAVDERSAVELEHADVDVECDEATEGGIVTTEEELELHRFAQAICQRNGYDPANILYRDTKSYFNVSYLKPTKWFLRFFSDGRRKFIITRVPMSEARKLTGDFEADEWTKRLRVFVDEVAQLWGLQKLILRSLEALQSDKGEQDEAESKAGETGEGA